MIEIGTERIKGIGRMWLDGFFRMMEQGTDVTTDTVLSNSINVYVKDKAGVATLYYRDDAQVEHEIGTTTSGIGGGYIEAQKRPPYWDLQEDVDMYHSLTSSTSGTGGGASGIDTDTVREPLATGDVAAPEIIFAGGDVLCVDITIV
jgi:hypothetical protein